MKLTIGLMIVLLCAFAALPISAQSQKSQISEDSPDGLPSALLNADAADSSAASGRAAPFSLTRRVLLPDREVVDCVPGQRCIFFPDGKGQETIVTETAASVDPFSGLFDQDPVTPSPSPSTKTGAPGADPDSPAATVPIPDFRNTPTIKEPGFAWGPALRQSLLFLAIEHGIRIRFDPPTRDALTGPFWNDYVSSSREYWISRLKAMGWSAGYSAFFELGFPISEAAVGNLGINRPPESPKMGYVDLVITPTLGIAWVVAEDAIDTYLIRYIESKTKSRTWRYIARSVLNPMRTSANALRFKYPWYRDDPDR